MAKYRRGLGKGKGSGWKNIAADDSKRHGMSAKGMKSAVLSPRLRSRIAANPSLKGMSFQKLQNKGVFLKYQGDADKDGVKNIHDCQPLNRKKQDDYTVEYGEPEAEILHEKALENLDEAIKENIESQRRPSLGQRIAGLGKKGYSYVSDLARKHREDRDKFNEEVQNLSDRQIRELAIRHKDTSLFGTGNPYEDELVRRQQERVKIKKRLAEANKPREPLF